MCSIISHPVVPVAISFLLPKEIATPKLVLAGAVCSIIPDLDVVAFRLGISYQDMFGHRGFSHSIVFAGLLAAFVGFILFRNSDRLAIKLGFLFVSTLSHALLDMLTNGGLGAAIFAPLTDVRFFFPFRPIEVSPLGIRNFFSSQGLEVIVNELKWVWLPSVAVAAFGLFVRRYWPSAGIQNR